MPAWPGTINQAVLLDGANLDQGEDNLSTFKPQVGRPKKRRRTSVPDFTHEFYQILTFDEWDDLLEFYDDDLLNGSQTFTRNHPRTGSTITCMFEERPTPGQPISANKYRVKFKIRQLGGN